MSLAAKTIANPTLMAANVIPSSAASLFTISKVSYSHPCLSIPFKPLKFHLSCSYSSSLSLTNSLSLKKKEPLSRVSVISAQQEENSPVVLEDQGQEFEGNFNWDVSGDDDEGQESDGYVEPSEEAKVYVGNLPYDVDSEKLAKIFEKAGIVEVAEIIYNRDTDQSRGFGFVTMSTVEEAEKAVELFHRYEVDGRVLIVSKSTPKGSRPERLPHVFDSASRIYVGSLPWSVDDARLEQIFSEYGNVVSARVVFDKESGRSRGFGFVAMSSESEMNDAIASLDGQTVDGRMIKVNVAADRRRSSF
ncbi:hypothetical protein OROHE_016224 [Orobanche hederae]